MQSIDVKLAHIQIESTSNEIQWAMMKTRV